MVIVESSASSARSEEATAAIPLQIMRIFVLRLAGGFGGLAEREGFEPSIELLDPITV